MTVGCGVASSVPKQADDVASIAAEGALLAGEVADGDSTAAFTRTHARALAGKAETLRKAISRMDLRRVDARVIAELEKLASAPGDREVGAAVERRLGAAAEEADEIGKAAQ